MPYRIQKVLEKNEGHSGYSMPRGSFYKYIVIVYSAFKKICGAVILSDTVI
jgi:hypothetical protein